MTSDTQDQTTEEISNDRRMQCIRIAERIAEMERIFDRYQRMALPQGNQAQHRNPELATRIFADVEAVRKMMTTDKNAQIERFNEVLLA